MILVSEKCILCKNWRDMGREPTSCNEIGFRVGPCCKHLMFNLRAI